MKNALRGAGRCITVTLCLCGVPGAARAQQSAQVRHIDLDTREGTWLSLDVSPDGRHIAFDLLGDIYLIEAGGGEARRLTELPSVAAQDSLHRGQPLNVQPRFSPDGRQIVFISDRDGADNVYVMNADGSGVHQISFGREMHTSPTWSRDGQSIAVRRITARPNAFIGSAGELVVYAIADGSHRRLTQTTQVRDVSGLEYSADGSAIYFAVPSDPVRNEIPHGRTFQIRRLDLKTNAVSEVTDDFGGAVRPRITPDGRFLAYATFDDGEMVLRMRELASNRERVVKRGIETSAALGGSQLDLMPGYAFSPDGSQVFLSYGGGIHRVTVADGTTARVPFHVRTTIQVGAANHSSQRVFHSSMPVRMLNWPGFTPDGKQAVFEAIGKIWTVAATGGEPRRVTSSSVREYAPAISPDGHWIAYVTWSDTARGHVFKIARAGGRPIRLTREAGYYANPNWSPDSRKLVVIVGDNADLRDKDPTQDQRRKLAWVDAAGGELHEVINTLESNDRFGGFQDIGAQFNADGTRLFYVTGDGAQLRSVALDGSDDRTHFGIANAQYQVPTYIAVSPDDSRVVFTAGSGEVWLMPLPAAADKPTVVNTRAKPLPGMIKVSAPAGYAPRWINHREISWGFGDKLYRRGIAASDQLRVTSVALNVAVPAGRGVVAFTDARLITMRGDEVIERGTLVVRDNRIVAVGTTDAVPVPAGARIISAKGATIVPGFMDVHDHGFGGSAIRNWPELHRKSAAKLAYGITLSRDLSAPVQAAFSLTELINSGHMPGPRAYAAGLPVMPPIFEVRTMADALAIVQMMQDLGGVVLKQYSQPTRFQRQLVAEAARRRQMMITAEGALDYKNNLSMLIDGYTATEHMWAPFPLYGDVGQLMARTGFFYTPTIGTSASGSEHWFRRMAVDTDAKQQRFILHSARESLARRVNLAKIAPEWEPTYYAVVRSVARLANLGARITTGSHDVPTPSGLGLHWEIWSYVEGGLTPLQAMRAATATAAQAIGAFDQLGTLEPGKLADLLVLKANPLEDIRNTIELSFVMRNGLLYNADTLELVSGN